MRRLVLILVGPVGLLGLLVLGGACGGGKSAPAALDAAPGDARATAEPSEPTTQTTPPPHVVPPPMPRMRLTLTLRSTPPGAAAAVDGRPIGQTPVVYLLDSDGRPHEFTFVLPGYAPWRIRFPPVRDGVIHATLVPMIFGDAGP